MKYSQTRYSLSVFILRSSKLRGLRKTSMQLSAGITSIIPSSTMSNSECDVGVRG